MGVFYTIYYLGCAVLPTIAGFLADASGSARATLWLAALLVLACSPLLALSRRAIAADR
jgi:cyanate permease